MVPHTCRSRLRGLGMQSAQEIARDLQAVIPRGTHVGERLEVLRQRLRRASDTCCVPLGAAESLLRRACALGRCGHATEADARCTDASVDEVEREGRADRRDVLVEALGYLVAAEQPPTARAWHAYGSEELAGLEVLLHVVEVQILERQRARARGRHEDDARSRSEEHTSELQSLAY